MKRASSRTKPRQRPSQEMKRKGETRSGESKGDWLTRSGAALSSLRKTASRMLNAPHRPRPVFKDSMAPVIESRPSDSIRLGHAAHGPVLVRSSKRLYLGLHLTPTWTAILTRFNRLSALGSFGSLTAYRLRSPCVCVQCGTQNSQDVNHLLPRGE